ncbi:MAG: thiolase family protein [Chloroflexota bacterium]
MREVVIIGVGMHPFGAFPEKSSAEMGAYAVRQALKDAGLEWKGIPAIYAGSMHGGSAWGNNIVLEMGQTSIPVVNCENACASGVAALRLAYHAIAGGIYDVACAVGVEKRAKGFIPLTGHPEWKRRAGMVAGPAFYAQEAQRYLHEYGVTVEHLAKVAVKSHKNASLCPNAHYQQYGNMTVQDVLNSRLVADPLRMYMVAPVSDGAACAIVCAQEIASRYSQRKPVTIKAVALSSGVYSGYTVYYPPGIDANVAKEAYEIAGLGPEDLDVVECQDAMASCEMMSAEALGICKPGEYARLVDEGAVELGGRIPVNTDGGYLSRGNAIGATGLAGVAELVWQLRGEAGPRQVKDARVGLNETFGDGPNCSVTILSR